MDQEIRWGIVGLGRIAHTFAQDLALVKGGKLTSVASRSLDKARDFAGRYGAENAFGSYGELFESDTVDIIYIATPHDSHEVLTIAAMDNGKHVLCEKPMGVNVAQVERMVASAKENDVFLMEALWSRFNPAIKAVKGLIDEGGIGDLAYLHADFAFYALDRGAKHRLLNPELAGGSLLDIGIYPIFLSYLLLGKPKKILANSKFYETGVEIQTSMIFEYENAQAVLYSGLNSKSEMKAEITGAKGSIFLHPKWHEAEEYSVEIDGEITKYVLSTPGNGYTYEIEEVHSCLQSNKRESNLWSLGDSLNLAGILYEIRQITGISFPFE